MRYLVLYLREGLTIYELDEQDFLCWDWLCRRSFWVNGLRSFHLPYLRDFPDGSWLFPKPWRVVLQLHLYKILNDGDETILLQGWKIIPWDANCACLHCRALFFFDWNDNLSFLPFILKQISPASTSILAPIVLRNGRPRMSGVSFVILISSTTKSTGMK